MFELFLLIVSAAGLLFGGELLVSSSTKIALQLGMSGLLIGLTVVSFGTSAPELFISLQSALAGHGDIAVGNIIGSNISNTLLILGACALVLPLSVPSQVIRREVPIMIFVSTIFLVMALDMSISRIEGIILVILLIIFIKYNINSSRKERQVKKELPIDTDSIILEGSKGFVKNSFLILLSLVFLSLGSKGFVYSASEIARWWGVSELVIGLTVVALGTSLPELITSMVATYRGERDLAVGNVIGSNIFNILCVLGICATVIPLSIPSVAISFDIPFMFFAAVGCLPIMFVDKVISRIEGLYFMFMYVLYTFYLYLISTSQTSVPVPSEVLLAFVIPISVLTLIRLYKKNKLEEV